MKNSSINGKKLLKLLILKFLTSDIINMIVNIVIPCILSVHCTKYIKNNKTWWIITCSLVLIIIIYNIFSTVAKKINQKNIRLLNIVYNCYNEQRMINCKFATKIYRLNNTIMNHVSSKTRIDKKALDNFADFQSVSFDVCQSIHKILNEEFGEDILCEVTLMKKEKNIIKMVAYANNNGEMPSSYKEKFALKNSDVYFVRLFNNLNAKIVCLSTQEDIGKNFKMLNGSNEREKNICQYVGIPVKTNRNEIEFLLQVDVSKPKILGKNEKQMKTFANNVFYPYAVLLHKTYERDLIFNKYYDMLGIMLSNK